MKTRQPWSWRRRLVIWGGALVALFIAFTGVVHIPAVQYAMGWTHPDGTGACPFGYDQQSAQVARPASARSPAFPVLGFHLAGTTRDEIRTWARTHGVACAAKRGGRLLECLDVPASALGERGTQLAGATLWFELDDGGVVKAIKTLRRTGAATDVASAFDATESALRARVGAPTTATGSSDPSDLSRGAFRQAMVAYAAGDYRAVIRATNMGKDYTLTENYSTR